MNNRDNMNNKTCIEGTCLDMCPPEEINLRIREKLVHMLEVTDEGYKLIKCYSRSAADSNMAVPRHLRPYQILLATIQYLLLDVSKRKDVKMLVMYDFLDDRLRAVRQDMTIQRLHPKECVKLLEPMIRFYVYYGYRLCEYSVNEFDPVLNKKCLLECIKWFLTCSDDLEETTNLESVLDTMKNLNISTNYGLSCDRSLVECLYIISNLCNIQPLYHYLSLPDHLKRLSAVQVAYEIAVANMIGNYLKIWRLAKRLCPLTFAALCLCLPTIQKLAWYGHVMRRDECHITKTMLDDMSKREVTVEMTADRREWKRKTVVPTLRKVGKGQEDDDDIKELNPHKISRRGLQVMSTAYHNKQLSVPTKVIQHWLGFNSEEEVRSTCSYYGLTATDVVCFNKSLFKSDAQEPQPKQHYMARISRLELEDVLLYTV